jgi:hypothetical protein
MRFFICLVFWGIWDFKLAPLRAERGGEFTAPFAGISDPASS